MTRITGEIVIDAPADVVFDFVADQRNEPAYNPHMVRSAKVTPGPVGKGTQFRSAVRSRGRLAEMTIAASVARPAPLATRPAPAARLRSVAAVGPSQELLTGVTRLTGAAGALGVSRGRVHTDGAVVVDMSSRTSSPRPEGIRVRETAPGLRATKVCN